MGYMTDKWLGDEYFKINDFDHVEFYVGNAKQVAHFYRSAFGLSILFIATIIGASASLS